MLVHIFRKTAFFDKILNIYLFIIKKMLYYFRLVGMIIHQMSDVLGKSWRNLHVY